MSEGQRNVSHCDTGISFWPWPSPLVSAMQWRAESEVKACRGFYTHIYTGRERGKRCYALT